MLSIYLSIFVNICQYICPLSWQLIVVGRLLGGPWNKEVNINKDSVPIAMYLLTWGQYLLTWGAGVPHRLSLGDDDHDNSIVKVPDPKEVNTWRREQEGRTTLGQFLGTASSAPRSSPVLSPRPQGRREGRHYARTKLQLGLHLAPVIFTLPSAIRQPCGTTVPYPVCPT